MKAFRTIILLAGLLAAPVLAQLVVPDRTALPIPKPVTLPPRTPQEATDKFMASKALLAMMKPVWNDEQIGRIIFIGWHNGAAALCGDLDVDPAKMAKAIASFVPAGTAKLTPEKTIFFHDNLVLDIGLATGWVMGGNFRDLSAFCANAKTEAASMPTDRSLFSVAEVPPK